MGIISYIREEIQVIRERDPAIKSNLEVFLYPSFKVILRYRLAHKLYLKKHYFLARWICRILLLIDFLLRGSRIKHLLMLLLLIQMIF